MFFAFTILHAYAQINGLHDMRQKADMSYFSVVKGKIIE